ncbi:DUF4440 domain-containing protein [Caulobacter sp. CCUG 60055]|uniref:DUF4440 domain-containing protein n=1 Tax=Caulobacter sp. CCUG 60055 TaxID=2100090 RepID=UPI001FA70C89|nr:DUF4440 domain-containing protein [Caulobacter sp. CCUG 60055]MBQ1540871.1 nuclear transport factor 2 family protein [Caulobacteraceae bacterium]MCI3179260.1 DUF4440 domain-containing protein [Caulobacter sp. CCUG 60055]
MTTAENAIRARRRLTNKFIAAHDAERLRPFFAPEVNVVVGDGALICGADAVIAAFAAQFRESGFVRYERSPDTVTPDQDGGRAAENGRWTGVWRDAAMAGAYMAVWRKSVGQWVIESELYVTLTRTEPSS